MANTGRNFQNLYENYKMKKRSNWRKLQIYTCASWRCTCVLHSEYSRPTPNLR